MQMATLKPAKVDRMMAITACIRTCLDWFTHHTTPQQDDDMMKSVKMMDQARFLRICRRRA